MELISLPGHTAPSGAEIITVVTEDGVSLRAALWRPVARRRPRGTVCILQGRAEFIEKYYEVVRDLRRRGFAVLTFDWRGQGASDREVRNPHKGHVGSFDRYRLDWEAVRAQILETGTAPAPAFGLAHSMGAAVALVGIKDGWYGLERLVAVSPMIDLCLIKAPRLARHSARILRALGFGRSFVPGGGNRSIATLSFEGNRLTSDEGRYFRNRELAVAMGSGAVGAPTIAWMDAAFRLMARFRDPGFAPAIRVPTLIVAAGADPVCATPVIERFASRLKAGHAIVIPGARHEILMESDPVRSQFWAAFDAFVPGTPDPVYSTVEQCEGSLVDAAVAGGDD